MRTYRVEIWYKILPDRERGWLERGWLKLCDCISYQLMIRSTACYGDWYNPTTFEALQAPTEGAAIEAAMLLVLMEHPIVDCFFRASTLRLYTQGKRAGQRRARAHPNYWSLVDYRFETSIHAGTTKADRKDDCKRLGYDNWNQKAPLGFGLISGKMGATSA